MADAKQLAPRGCSSGYRYRTETRGDPEQILDQKSKQQPRHDDLGAMTTGATASSILGNREQQRATASISRCLPDLSPCRVSQPGTGGSIPNILFACVL